MNYDLAVQAQTITVPEGSWVGNLGTAGVGVVLLVGSWLMAKNKILLYGDAFAERLKTVKFDWKSMMSLFFGFFGVTALLGSTSVLGDFVRGIQNFLEGLGDIELLAGIGMAGFCFIALIMVFRKSDDSVADMRWGYGLAILFPLGGGIFSDSSVWAGEFMVNLLGGVSA